MNTYRRQKFCSQNEKKILLKIFWHEVLGLPIVGCSASVWISDCGILLEPGVSPTSPDVWNICSFPSPASFASSSLSFSPKDCHDYKNQKLSLLEILACSTICWTRLSYSLLFSW